MAKLSSRLQMKLLSVNGFSHSIPLTENPSNSWEAWQRRQPKYMELKRDLKPVNNHQCLPFLHLLLHQLVRNPKIHHRHHYHHHRDRSQSRRDKISERKRQHHVSLTRRPKLIQCMGLRDWIHSVTHSFLFLSLHPLNPSLLLSSSLSPPLTSQSL